MPCKMPQSVRERYEKMKEQPNHMPNIDAMIENFDKALAHPDDNDLNALKQLVANNAQLSSKSTKQARSSGGRLKDSLSRRLYDSPIRTTPISTITR